MLLALVGTAALVLAQGANLAQATGGNAAPIVYQANPPHRIAFAQVPSTLPSPSQCIQRFGLACYTPQEIKSAYDVPPGLTGKGQAIVIVEAFGSPTIRQDLHRFDLTFGLPDPTLDIYNPDGRPKFSGSPVQLAWAAETSLDVEWAHAIAPEATIALVVAPTPNGNAINVAERFAVQKHLGNVLSMSFGAPEAAISGKGNNLQLQQADSILRAAAEAGISSFASAGDFGATNGYAVPNASFPASDPNVTAVGGTDLFVGDAGTYQGETAWNDTEPGLCPFGCAYGPYGATGGAPSVVFPAPPYESAVTGQTMRTTADVAYNASTYTAVLAYLGFLGGQSGFYFVGGTSEGAPQWAAIAALADEAAGHPLGLLNPKLYQIARSDRYATSFHDVTVGDNAFHGPGFPAGSGYDLPTGLGSPDVANLIQTLTGR